MRLQRQGPIIGARQQMPSFLRTVAESGAIQATIRKDAGLFTTYPHAEKCLIVSVRGEVK